MNAPLVSDNAGKPVHVPASPDAPPADSAQRRKTGLKAAIIRFTLRMALRCWHGVMRLLTAIIPRRRSDPDGVRVLVTGKFLSDTWVGSFLYPMAKVTGCAGVWTVTAFPIPPTPGVHAVYPPGWMQRLLGQAAARTLMFAWYTLRLRPHVIGGFHLLLNGLAAGLLARLIGARCFYVCLGGQNELNDGGLYSENSLFVRIESPDPILERLLLKAVGRFDRVVTMGHGAMENFRQRGVSADFHPIPAAIDTARFRCADIPRDIDVLFVGRLVEVKRVDILLQAVAIAARTLPDVRAVIVGDGPLRGDLETRAAALDLSRDQVQFVGQQARIEEWHQRAKIFVLTSDSEGVSLAMLEAMSCGAVPIVSDVGDLKDMIEEGRNGFLIERRRPDLFAQRFVELLSDLQRLAAMSLAAQRIVERVALQPSIARWTPVIT